MCTHKTIKEQAHTGRRRLLDDACCKRAYRWMVKTGRMSARAISAKLKDLGLIDTKMSRTTVISSVRRYLKSHKLPNITATWTRPKKRLSEENKQARLTFAQSNLDKDWASVMFTDRVKFQLYHPGVQLLRRIWRVVGEPWEEFSVNKPSATFNVYGGVTIHGTTKLIPVTGTTSFKPCKDYKTLKGAMPRGITQAEYKDVALALLREGWTLFQHQPWELMQDGDKAHKVADEVVHAWNGLHHGNVVVLKHWPSNSPDLNIIENIWGYIADRVQAAGCKNGKQFKARVVKEFSHLPKAYIERLFNTIPQRLRQCIKRNGGRTKHKVTIMALGYGEATYD